MSPDFHFQELQADSPALSGHRGSFMAGRALPVKAFIGEMVSLIYSPFDFKGGVLFDAILDHPATQSPESPPEDWSFDPDPTCHMRFIPMLCPNCGWDLEGERNALVLLCRNCDSAWQASGGTLEKLDFTFPLNVDEGAFCLPFWRIRAGISGVRLGSYADLVRLANLPKAIQSKWEEQPIAFWIPAFKIQPQLFLRLIRIFTSSQPMPSSQEKVPRAPLHPVNLPLVEAIESIRVALVSLAAKRELLLAKLSEVQIGVEEQNLVYFPFVLKGSDLIQPAMQVSISANALNWGKLL